MKAEFSQTLEKIGKRDKDFVFLTGDLGFNAFENIMQTFGKRFINAGVAEQNMVSVAAGMARMGLQPWVYSIATFLTLKTFEQVRNDVCFLNLPVKLVGNGGGYGYGIMGETHHALEDLAIYTSLENLTCYVPAFSEDVPTIMQKMYKSKSPAYLRLTNVPKTQIKLPIYAPLRKIASGNEVTIVALGPLVHEVLPLINNNNIDLFCISELPVTYSLDRLITSVKKTKRLLILEEHRREGGMGEKVLSRLINHSVAINKVIHLYANGYPSGLYGSRGFHLEENMLNSSGVKKALQSIHE